MNRDDLCIYGKLVSRVLGISEIWRYTIPYARENLQHCWETFTRERLALWGELMHLSDVVYHKFIMY